MTIFGIFNMTKNCKINTTAYNPMKSVKMGENWPFHPQDLHTPQLYQKMIERLFRVEKETDPGVDVDSYMVVYKDKWGLWQDWIQFDNQPIKRGTFYVLFEERNGGNYQMFNMCYQKIKDKYDWFIFTCDDIMVFGDQYYKKILERWEEGCGYVALQGGGEILPEEMQHHVQGSIGLTSKKILEEVCKINNGELPHNKKEPWTQEANIFEGEIPFTNKILELGYHFVNYCDSKEWKLENLCYPYFLYAQICDRIRL
jgi:hypothetical protein